MNLYDRLFKKITGKRANVSVIGLGYIGLPTALFYAMKGLKVTGIDTNRNLIDDLKRGVIPVHEEGLEDLGKRYLPRMQISDSYNSNANSDVLVLCLPTPLDENGKSVTTYLENSVKDIANHNKGGSLFLVESTVPIGTTERLSALFAMQSGLELDNDFWFAHCPERVLPGKVLEEMETNHRLVGGVTHASTSLGVVFLESIFQPDHVHPTSALVSEAAKLAENAYRDVNIAYANELAKICTVLSIDVSEVIQLANLHPRVSILKPGLGVGGYCLPKDGWILVQSAKERGGESKLIPIARSINDSMPSHVAKRIRQEVLAASGKSAVGLIGMAFKENVSDTRNSPAVDLLHVLTSSDVDVFVYDPLVRENYGGKKVDSLDDLLELTDILVLCVGHDRVLNELESRDLSEKVFVDPRNLLPEMKSKAKKYVGLSV